MSAKHAKKQSKPVAVTPAVQPANPAPVAPGEAAATGPAQPRTASTDARNRMLRQLMTAGVWIYVAALWLLALDQTFDWGIFGPNVPPPV